MEKRISLDLPGIELGFLGHPTRSQVAIPVELYWLYL
jgi:hypothetical protein